MNLSKIIPLTVFDFLLLLSLGFFSVKLTNNTNIIFNPKSALPLVVAFLLLLMLFVIFTGLSIGVIKDSKKSQLFGLILYSGYILGTFSLTQNIGEHTSIIILHYAIVLIGLFISIIHFNSELKRFIEFNLGKLSITAFKFFFIFLTIAMAFMFNINNSNLKLEDIITDNVLNTFVDPVTTIIEKQVNKQINDQVNEQLSGLNIDLASNLSSILPMVSQNISKSILDNYSGDIDTTNIGVIYSEDNQLLEVTGLNMVVKPIIKSTIIKYATPYEKWLTIITTVLFYLTIAWLISITKILILPIAWLVKEFLTKTGYIKKITETIEVERITL